MPPTMSFDTILVQSPSNKKSIWPPNPHILRREVLLFKFQWYDVVIWCDMHIYKVISDSQLLTPLHSQLSSNNMMQSSHQSSLFLQRSCISWSRKKNMEHFHIIEMDFDTMFFFFLFQTVRNFGVFVTKGQTMGPLWYFSGTESVARPMGFFGQWHCNSTYGS